MRISKHKKGGGSIDFEEAEMYIMYNVSLFIAHNAVDEDIKRDLLEIAGQLYAEVREGKTLQ